jgi:peroxiredoxin Q/BCP
MSATIGKSAPQFSLRSHDGTTISLKELRGKPVVLYFYPADDTPGCTKESCDFRDLFPRFRQSNATILGVSPDSVQSHARFRDKFKLPFALLADTEKEVAQLYGVWREKNRFGRRYMGVVRTTFLIDEEGILREIIPVTRVEGHADDVLARLP